MIKNIVFDFGNVLAKFDPYEIFYTYTNNDEQAMTLYELMISSKLWEDLDKGIDPIDVIKKMKSKSEESYFPAIEKIITTWIKVLKFDDQMGILLTRLKEQGFNLYMLSNTSKQFYEFKKNNPIFEVFDGLYISADSKLIKPNQDIYLDFLDVFNLKSTESVFIDDKKENILTAHELGFKTYHYQNDFIQLVTYLESLLSISLEIK